MMINIKNVDRKNHPIHEFNLRMGPLFYSIFILIKFPCKKNITTVPIGRQVFQFRYSNELALSRLFQHIRYQIHCFEGLLFHYFLPKP